VGLFVIAKFRRFRTNCLRLSITFAAMTAKQELTELLARLPDETSLEDIQYHIYVREKVQRGLRDAEAGRVISAEEAEERMDKWLTPRASSGSIR
jgi:predicted transcriptional regulator